MQIMKLSVGPILGETTPSRARIWGRGEVQLLDGLPRRCFGALRYREDAEGTEWSQAQIFKMNPNFDMTGIGILSGLTQSTRYRYQIGYFFSDDELTDVRLESPEWDAACEGHFRTASDDPDQPRILVLGSCRYLLKTFLGDFFDDRGDKTFRSVLRRIEDGDRIDQLIMMGDQVYADDLGPFNPDKTVDQFFRRYRAAFGQPHLRALMGQVPTYMILDDHEIENDWPANASDKDWRTLFPVAMHAYQSYQLAHGPSIRIVGGRLVGTPDKLWYSYSDGCCDFFVMDCRTERIRLPDGTAEMVGQVQMRALKRWLRRATNRVKLIVTSVPFFPDSTRSGRSDKWSGFPDQRKQLLEFIDRHQIHRVVFCSGDIHAAVSVELRSTSGLIINSVVSSAFFWPYPHAGRHQYDLDGVIDGGAAGKFTLQNASNVVVDNNFTRLNVSPDGLAIDVFERKGKRRSSIIRSF